MRTVFLCYEMNPHTGLSEVKEVSFQVGFAKDYISYNSSAHHVEEWIVDSGNRNGNGKINEFYSIEDFEERK